MKRQVQFFVLDHPDKTVEIFPTMPVGMFEGQLTTLRIQSAEPITPPPSGAMTQAEFTQFMRTLPPDMEANFEPV